MKVKAPDGTVINFPDGMSMMEIEAIMRENYPAGAATNEPTLEDASREVYGFDESLDRATLLPFAKTQEGEVVPAVPQVLKNVLESALLPGHAAGGGTYTPEDVTNFALDIGVPATARGAAGPVARAVSKRAKQDFIDRAPSAEDLAEYGVSLKNRALATGTRVKADHYLDLMADFETIAGMNRMTPGLHDKTVAAYKKVMDEVGKEHDLEDLHIIRRLLNEAQKSTSDDDRRIASLLVDRLDRYVDDLTVDNVVSGQPEGVGKLLRDFRSYYHRSKKVDEIQGIIDQAKVSASGFHNGLRVGFRSLLKSKKRMRGFTEGEKKLIEEAAMGTGTNLIRTLGQLGFGSRGQNIVGAGIGAATGGSLGGGLGTLAGGPAGGMIGGALGTAAAVGTGTLARQASTRQALMQAELARAAAGTGRLPPTRGLLNRMLDRALYDATMKGKAALPVAAATQPRRYPPGFI